MRVGLKPFASNVDEPSHTPHTPRHERGATKIFLPGEKNLYKSKELVFGDPNQERKNDRIASFLLTERYPMSCWKTSTYCYCYKNENQALDKDKKALRKKIINYIIPVLSF